MNPVADLGLWEKVGLWSAAFLLLALSVWFGHKEAKGRVPLRCRPQEYEPVLWAERGSWWKVPVYRLEKLAFVDCCSPAGAFLGVMVWMNFELLPKLAKDTWLVPSVLLGLLATACFNFALPKYRGEFILAMVGLVKSAGYKLAGKDLSAVRPPGEDPAADLSPRVPPGQGG